MPGTRRREDAWHAGQDEERSSRGYYEQAVPALLPRSLVKGEVMAGGNNFSLFREYLSTEPDMDQFQFSLAYLIDIDLQDEDQVNRLISWAV